MGLRVVVAAFRVAEGLLAVVAVSLVAEGLLVAGLRVAVRVDREGLVVVRRTVCRSSK